MPLTTWLVFGVLAGITLAGAVWVVTLHNLFRAALSLGIVLVGIAGLFILLEAEFLAFVQILIYVGAILALIVFAIMLTGNLHSPTVAASRRSVPAAVASFGLFVVLAAATQPLIWPKAPEVEAVPLAVLGQQLVTTLALPFEIVSLIFVAAIVGAIAIAVPRAPKTPGSQG
jgi:NADH:ubiquinone oxidoreductase subunit 6 (subunit J)